CDFGSTQILCRGFPQLGRRRKRSGSFAIFAAIHRARVSVISPPIQHYAVPCEKKIEAIGALGLVCRERDLSVDQHNPEALVATSHKDYGRGAASQKCELRSLPQARPILGT